MSKIKVMVIYTYKLHNSDEDFLYGILDYLENGENLERALFFDNSIPAEIKFELQFGMSLEKTISMIEFNYPIVSNLLLSLMFNTNEEAIKRIKATANIIRKQNEIMQEKTNLLKIHQRRIKIIRLISTVIIGILAGFSPLISNFYSLINNEHVLMEVNYLSPLCFSFLLINIINSYFLLVLSNEDKKTLKVVITILTHLLLVITVSFILKKFSFYPLTI